MLTLLKTKTTWLGLAAIITAVGLYVGGEINVIQLVEGIGSGLACIFLRHAIVKLKP